MTKAPTATEKSKKHQDNIKKATKNFDYTTIADRRSFGVTAVNPTGVVKPVYVRTTFPLNRDSRVIKSKHLYKFVNNPPDRD